MTGVRKLGPLRPWYCGQYLADLTESQSPSVKPLRRGPKTTGNNEEGQMRGAQGL